MEANEWLALNGFPGALCSPRSPARTPRLPAVAGARTTCVCCFYRVPCATVMNRNAQNQAELPVDYKWRKIPRRNVDCQNMINHDKNMFNHGF